MPDKRIFISDSSWEFSYERNIFILVFFFFGLFVGAYENIKDYTGENKVWDNV